jgi:hypothetical protein
MSAIALKQPTLLQRIEAGEVELPVLPDFAMKILQKIEHGGAAADVSPAVEKDQALSAQMVRLANSAFYAGSERVRSVSAAVVRVGVRSVASFVAANMQKSMYVSRDPVRGGYLKDLWRHALGVATVGQHIAKVQREPDTSNSVRGGLLTDRGDTALVGAPYDDDTHANSGSVYAFDRSGVVWTQMSKIHSAMPQNASWVIRTNMTPVLYWGLRGIFSPKASFKLINGKLSSAPLVAEIHAGMRALISMM